MTALNHLLKTLDDLGVELRLEADKLKYDAPQGVMTPALLEQLKTHREALVAHFENQRWYPPLSPAQERLWFLDQLAGGGLAAYNMPLAFRLKGTLNRDTLDRAFATLMQRHDLLRTGFPAHEGRPYHHTLPYAEDRARLIQLDHLTPEARQAAITQILTDTTAEPFDLSRPPLMRRCLIRCDAHDHVLLVVIHHILADGWSLGLIADELARLYNGDVLPPPTCQFLDLATSRPGTSPKNRDFWRQLLTHRPDPLNLPTKKARPETPGFQGATASFVIEPGLFHRVEQALRRHHVTLFVLLESALAVLLGRLGHCRELLVGTPVSDRQTRRHEEVIGLLINTVVLRNDLRGNPSVATLLERTSQHVTDVLEHTALPFDQMVQLVEGASHGATSPLFQVLFVLQNAPYRPSFAGGLQAEMMEVQTRGAKFDLTLSISETSAGLRAQLEYDSQLFDADFAQQFGLLFQRVLKEMIEHPDRPIEALNLFDEHHKRELLAHMSAAPIESQTDNLIQLFLSQAEREPDRPALIMGRQDLSYGALAQLALRHARAFAQQGLGPGSLVAVWGVRRMETIAVIIGALAAGAAYLPLDPTLPDARLLAQLNTTQPQLLFADKDVLPQWHGPRLDQPATSTGRLVAVPANAPAYVIFTSGSTGRPKGVTLPHRVLLNLILNVDCGDGQDVTLQAAPFGFDVSFQEMFTTLCSGGTLVLTDEHTRRDPLALANLIRETAVKRIFMPFTALQQLAEAVGDQPLDLNTIIHAGEPLHLTPAIRALAAPPVRLLNQYGPSETHVVTTALIDTTGPEVLPPIGLPIPGCITPVLDHNLEPVPSGCIGRLFLGGLAVGDGYVGNPAATAERFVPDPYSTQPGSRFYDSGDLARLQGGLLHLAGRADTQIKCRGYRIEPAEIEAALEEHPLVLEAVVKPTQPAGTGLIAFLRTRQTPVDPAQFRTFLARQLPAYMIPNRFEFLDHFPKTASGKVHRQALKASTHPAKSVGDQGLADAQVVDVLQRLWAEVLELDSVDPDANFFDLGGHSLLMVPLITRINQTLNLKLQVMDLFRHPNIRALAAKVGGRTQSPVTASTKLKTADKIAVIGMACRLPGAPHLQAFRDVLYSGRETTTTFAQAELAAAGVPAEVFNDARYVPVGTRLNDYDCFDADFFSISPLEAATMDPQHRLFLEEAWHALEDAGYAGGESHIGVFAGVDLNRYLLQNLLADTAFNQLDGVRALIGNDKDYVTTRVSYKLQLTGPSINVQTACSTSLTAVHLAAQSLRRGECNLALAGGASLQVPEESGYLFQPGGILSPDGHCRAFDAEAGGTIAASGVGVVVLKPLDRARADGDHIYAVLAGSAVNNDGGDKVGYTAPGLSGQARVIGAALDQADLRADQIDMVEAHGTGTTLGDPAEIAALQQAYGPLPQGTVIALGSLKSNMGHLGAAAGVAGLIKACLQCCDGRLAPSLHFQNPNPNIDFGPFQVNTTARPWPRRANSPRRAGVSSFGIGGSNAHVIIEEPPQTSTVQSQDGPQLLVLSARTAETLTQSRDTLVDFLHHHPELLAQDLAFTLAVGRKPMARKLYGVIDTNRNWLEQLAQLKPERPRVKPGKPVFLLSGEGADPNLLTELSSRQGGIQADVDACYHILKDMDRAQESQHEAVTAFVAGYSLARFWMRLGLTPNALVGHDIGRITAGCLAQVFSLEDALRLVLAHLDATPRPKELTFKPPRIAVISTVTGAALSEEEALKSVTWIGTAEADRVDDALKTARGHGDLMLECGAGSQLTERAAHRDPSVLALPTRPKEAGDAHVGLLQTLGRLWSVGVPIDWHACYTGQHRRRLSLPGYPFERQRHWIDPARTPVSPAEVAAVLRPQLTEMLLEIDAQTMDAPSLSAPELEALCGRFVLDILDRMGWQPTPGMTLTTPNLAAQLGVAPDRVRQLDTLLHILAHEGVLAMAPGDWATTPRQVVSCPQPGDPRADALALRATFPDAVTALDMLLACAEAMPQILRGQKDTAEILFPAGDADGIAGLYRDLPLQQEMNELMATAVQYAVRVATPETPAQILEIGAGTGATTVGILPKLPADRVRFTFTDISAFFTVKAQAQFAQYPYMSYRVFNAERDPAAQGFQPASFRVVTASNVIHATRDLRESLGHAFSLLEPGGMLVLLEGTGRSNFADLVFGGLSGWNRFTDFDVRTSLCPSLDTWRRLLSEVGFDQVATVPETETQTNRGTAILLARRPLDGGVVSAGPSHEAASMNTAIIAPQTPTETVLCRIMAKVFGVPQVGRDTDFFELGGDSLIAIQLNQNIHEELGHVVDAADLMDYPTPAQLAAWLDSHDHEAGA